MQNIDKVKEQFNKFILTSKNKAKEFGEKLKAKFQSNKASDSQEQDSNENISQTSDNSEATKTAPEAKTIKEPKQIGLTIALVLLGVIASLVFIAAIVIALKPSLLEGKVTAPKANYSTVVKKVGNIILKIEATRTTSASAAQMFFTGLDLIIFGALKIIILLAAKSGSKKIVSALTLTMTYFACFMMSDKFLLFSIFILLLYLTFDYSCGLSTRAVFIKLGVVVISAIVIYIAVHFAIDPSLRFAAKKLFEGLRLPILRWI